MILYFILGGRLPFDNEDKEIMFRNIVTSNVIFDGPVWNLTSNEAKKFIKELLVRHPKDRKEIDELLKDKWLTQYVDCNKQTDIITLKENIDDTVMRNYKKKVSIISAAEYDYVSADESDKSTSSKVTLKRE